MDFTLLFFILLISFTATLVRSTVGFGESLIAVPLFMLFLPVETAVPLSVLISLIVALVVVVQDRKKIHLKSARWLILSALPGIPLGLLLLTYGSDSLVKMCLGILIVLYAAYSLWVKPVRHVSHDHKGWLLACGFLSGILGGAYGLNGPPLVVYGHLRRWSAKHFRATLQAYFLPASLAALIGYASKGLLTSHVLKNFFATLPVVLPAIFLGRHLNHRLKDGTFFNYVYWGLLFIGIVLVVTVLR